MVVITHQTKLPHVPLTCTKTPDIININERKNKYGKCYYGSLLVAFVTTGKLAAI